MDKISINYNPDYIKMPPPWWKRREVLIFVGAIILVGFITFKLGLAYNTIVVDNSDKEPWWKRAANVLPFVNGKVPEPTPDLNPLPEKESERLDILMLGIRGEGDLANGGLLTDSIQVLSINKSDKTVSIISLPRDLYIKVGDFEGKLNEVYERGLAKGDTFNYTKETISRLTGIYIDKMAVLDFEGFLGIIDKVGGIDVTLEKEFKETQQWGYEFYLPEGENHLEAQEALYYVRSRYSTNDFDRSRRQQQVLLATKDKVLSIGTLLNPIKLSGIISEFKDNLRTDISILNIGDMIDLLKSMSESLPETYVISTENLLDQIVDDGVYKLLPKDGNYEGIKQTFETILTKK
ncbi:MAG: hypothetical protein COV29_01580 [Candidatus Yanofskybacteria bacterium CG10_big_fil_rev_8_21_14_0_10_36_16]|uniref:Cell envelope-related transcriptional attenuator domain-containing protein n=1 Tax=Candidatus Yanofskybacteria bacterium CG10_big_fil_rev_8_21_14_0_10_36_16 TaxID=1975096 RepID=A0A2J0Q7A4_9BACT|nr:MAG: hypothetical protein COV29_01580 [Candidatus Yanofskybacteria bacterium CG10_big_fil_rev_8_21_14_0_10_36_16]